MRPRHAYAFGLVDLWAKLASVAPGVVNLLTQSPGLSDMAKLAAGIAPQRRIPAFAPQSFQQWVRQRRSRNGGKAYLKNVIGVLRREILWGVPIVVLEPSCPSVFRDELPSLLAHDEHARKLARQTFLLSEFLSKYAVSFSPPQLQPHPSALVHGHCHQKALMGTETELEWLKKVGVQAEVLDSGCCGMAGSFGFEKDKYEVSVKCGEHALLPRVRAASPETLIVAAGFSCQEQIAQLTGRHALHPAQVIQLALNQDLAIRKTAGYPEQPIVERRERAVRESMIKAGVSLAGLAAAGVGMFWLSRGPQIEGRKAA